MAYDLHDNPLLHAPKILDARYGPWVSVGQALDYVKGYMRALGLTVGVHEGGGISEYWWKEGIEDHHLVYKGAANLHDRLHAIDSVDDHAPASEINKGKYVRANPITGNPEYHFPLIFTEAPPINGVDGGEIRQMIVCDDFLYICVAGGGPGVARWKRAPLRNY